MGIQLRGGNSRNRNNSAGQPKTGETPEMREIRERQENEVKEAIAQKQAEMRMKALAFEQRDAARKEREELKNNPELAAKQQRKIDEMKAEEEKLAQIKAEEEAKIQAERRVHEKRMDQTEALIAAIRAQVEKERAAKNAANQKQEATKTASNKQAAGGNSKPTYRTISPEEMQKLEEKKRMKAAGIQPKETTSSEGVSGGLGGLGNGPTLSNPNGNGPTLSNPNAGKESLTNMGMNGGGLGIEIKAPETEDGADESTVALDVKAINDAVDGGSASAQSAGNSGTIVVDDGNTWNTESESDNNPEENSEEITWVDSGVKAESVTSEAKTMKNDDIVSVIPVRQRPGDANDVHSAYNIDFDDDDDDDDFADLNISSNGNSKKENKVEEEAKRKAEEAAKRKAEEDAKRKAAEEAKRKAEEERRKTEEEAKRKAEEEEEEKRKAEEEAKRKAEEERRKAEEEAKRKAAEEEKRKAEEEAKRKAAEEARRKAEEEARRKAEEEAARKVAEEEARRKAEEEARRKAEEEAARKAAEEEARRKAEEEARRKAEEEAARKAAEEEARRKAEEEARRKAEEEAARKAAEEEARRKAEEEARRKAEEEAARKAAEEEARRKAEEEARRKAEEEAARKAAEEEARRKAEEEIKRKAEEEARKAEEEALKYKRMAEEAARKAAEAEKALEAARQQAEPKTAAVSQTTEYSLPVGAEQFLGKYLTVASISDQIVQTIKYISENPTSPRNVVILGQYGFGTTTIAEDFARSFHAMGICKNKTIAKIKGGALNRANISDAISKLQGGCLVVENAGVISNEKLDEIYQIVNNPNNDVVVILTGQIETLSRVFKDNVVISSQFKHLIQVHRITDLDVLSIAKNHAKGLGYPCEQGAESSLRRRMQEVESGNLDRVLKIVDNAVSKAHNREMSTGEQEHHLLPGDFE